MLSTIQVAIEQYTDYIIQNLSISSDANHNKPRSEIFLPLYLVIEQLRDDYDALLLELEDGSGDEIGGAEDNNQQSPLLHFEEIEYLYDTLIECLIDIEDVIGGGGGKKKKRSKIPSINDAVNYKKLSNVIKSFVGTKVYNKWKRNRSEL